MMTIEAWLFIEAAEAKCGIPRSRIKELLEQDCWCYPEQFKSKRRDLWKIFDTYRARANNDSGTLKCNCSELLSLYGLLRHWAEMVVGDRPAILKERESFMAACKVVDLFLLCKRAEHPGAHLVSQHRSALSEHMKFHLDAYGDEHIIPKHHWNFDVPGQIEIDGMLVDTFAIERAHLFVKYLAELIKNTRK